MEQEKKLTKKQEKQLEKARLLKLTIEEAQAELKLINIKLQKEIAKGTSLYFLGWAFTHKGESVRTSLDTKALKEAHPTIFEEFTKESIVKGGITINKPKAK